MYILVLICTTKVRKCTFLKGTTPVTAFVPFFLSVLVENSCADNIFVETVKHFFRIISLIESSKRTIYI